MRYGHFAIGLRGRRAKENGQPVHQYVLIRMCLHGSALEAQVFSGKSQGSLGLFSATCCTL